MYLCSRDPRSSGTATGFFDIAGMRVRTRVEGTGPSLLLINGIGANIEVLEPLRRRLLGRQLISFDAPGTGASPPPPRPLRMRDLADLVDHLLHRLGCDRTDVLGYSFGGALAQQLAHQHPGRVRRLVLAGTIPGLGGFQNPWMIAQLLDPRLRDRRGDRRLHKKVARIVGGRSGRDPAVLAVYERDRLAYPPTLLGYESQLRALIGWSSLPWLHTLRAPTLVLAGESDPIVPIINTRIFTRLIPNCRRYVVPGGGHLFLIDQPDDVVGPIEAFLSGPAPLDGAESPGVTELRPHSRTRLLRVARGALGRPAQGWDGS
jgi:pimeloyl-ACP methyl ester carboxylesterase